MKKLSVFLFVVSWLVAGHAVAANGPYTSKIVRIVENGAGSPFTALWVEMDLTSAHTTCASSQTWNRVTITTERQLSVLLAAVMVDAEITFYIDGNACGTVGIDDLTHVYLEPPL